MRVRCLFRLLYLYFRYSFFEMRSLGPFILLPIFPDSFQIPYSLLKLLQFLELIYGLVFVQVVLHVCQHFQRVGQMHVGDCEVSQQIVLVFELIGEVHQSGFQPEIPGLVIFLLVVFTEDNLEHFAQDISHHSSPNSHLQSVFFIVSQQITPARFVHYVVHNRVVLSHIEVLVLEVGKVGEIEARFVFLLKPLEGIRVDVLIVKLQIMEEISQVFHTSPDFPIAQ